jgi:hypothetical protein
MAVCRENATERLRLPSAFGQKRQSRAGAGQAYDRGGAPDAHELGMPRRASRLYFIR